MYLPSSCCYQSAKKKIGNQDIKMLVEGECME